MDEQSRKRHKGVAEEVTGGAVGTNGETRKERVEEPAREQKKESRRHESRKDDPPARYDDLTSCRKMAIWCH